MSEKIGHLKMVAPDGKMRDTDVADQEQLFRLVQSIPSPKVEPIKLWIARVSSERIDEMIDPELSIDRAIDMYRRKGYSEEWSEDIELAFRARLSRSKDLYNKTQYLRIQASYLLSSSDPTIQNVGLGMMNEVLSDYPDINDVIFNKFDALVNVGDFFYRREDFETAYINYKKAIGYDKKKTVVQDHAYHGFIKSAVFSKHEEAYPAGLKYLEDARDTNLLFLSEIYDHYLASAMLYAAIGRHETAKECASVSLRVLNEESPLHMKDKPVATEREYMFLSFPDLG